jgi:hypothetical protein
LNGAFDLQFGCAHWFARLHVGGYIWFAHLIKHLVSTLIVRLIGLSIVRIDVAFVCTLYFTFCWHFDLAFHLHF